MKKCLLTILTAALVISVVFASGCGGKQSYSIEEVLSSFSSIAEHRTLVGRENIYPWWSARISEGSVKHIADGDYYQIEFPGMAGGSEVWGIEMNNSRIWPINQSALLMAFALFCHSAEDPNTDCQQWAHQLETAK